MNNKLLLTGVMSFIAAAALGAVEERGNLVLDNIPNVDTPLTTRLEDYLSSRGANFVDWLPDDSLLIATRFGDTEQLHRVATPRGAREQLTFFREPVTTARAPQSAVAPGFAFLRDQGGNENAQVFYYDLTTRAVRMLSSGKGVNGTPTWSRDGRRVAYHSTARDGVSYDLMVAEPGNAFAAPRLVFNGFQKMWSVEDWSPDDTKLLISNFVSANESHLYVMDIASAALTPVSEGETPASVSGARFTADGRGVLLVTNRDSEFEQLRRVDLVTGAVEILTGHIPWDIESFARTDDGRYLAWVANVDGAGRLTVLDMSRRTEALPPIPDGRIGRIAFDRAGKRLALSLESPQSPRDVFVLELDRNAVVRYTRSEPGAIDPLQFAPAELIRFPTFDRENGKQRQIPALVYKPRGTPGPHPVIVEIHGGPESQAQPGWNPFTQFLVREMGFVVITPMRRSQELPGPRQWRRPRGCNQGHRGPAGVDRRAARPGCEEGVRVRRLLRRLHVTGEHGAFQRPAARRHRRGRHLEFRDLSREHLGVPARAAAARVRRRTPAEDARLPAAHLAADECGAHLEAIAGGAGAQRSARTRQRIAADGGEDPRSRRRGLVPGGEGRGARLQEEAEPRLLPEDHRSLPGEAARGTEVDR